jgi:ABC-type transporter Mla subunit MlaD
VADNRATLTPALQQLSTVTDILDRNRDALGATINNLAPFVRVFTNTLGNGRWFDSFVDNLLPGVVGGVLCAPSSQTPLPVSCSGGK